MWSGCWSILASWSGCGARQRYEEQGRDTLSVYQDVARGTGPAAVRARAYRGLVEAGGTVAHEATLDLVRST
jgi:hypothetical protein